MSKGDERAQQIYETIGVYLGYAIPHYADLRIQTPAASGG